jgi:hypothetical protein
VSTHSTEIQRNIPEEAGGLDSGARQCRHPDGNERASNMSLIELPSWPSWMVLVVDLRREACILRTQAGGWRRESK